MGTKNYNLSTLMRLLPQSLYLAAALCLVAAHAISQANPGEITQAEIKAAINESAECASPEEINLDLPIQYFDFIGSGTKQAVVVAATCLTGTAGPDIHAVFNRDAKGKVAELPFRHAEGDPFFNTDGPQLPVFGNRNYRLEIEDGKLAAKWGDTSDREDPLTIWYKWDGKEFVVDYQKAEGPYPTSYDCGKAKSEIDRAICYSPKISALDVQLAKVYRAAVGSAAQDQKKALQGRQREWLTERNKQCTIYKWWVDCLTDMYIKRIAELEQTPGAIPRQ